MEKSQLKKLAEIGDKIKFINNKKCNLTFDKTYEVIESYFSQIRQDYKVVIKDDFGSFQTIYSLSFKDNFKRI
jgi:hypothetical protein